MIGAFKLVSFNRQEMTLDWEGRIIHKRLNEGGSEKPKAQAADRGNGTARPGVIPGQAAPQADAAQTARVGNGTGRASDRHSRACQAGDSSPSGAVSGGYRKKVTRMTPLGHAVPLDGSRKVNHEIAGKETNDAYQSGSSHLDRCPGRRGAHRGDRATASSTPQQPPPVIPGAGPAFHAGSGAGPAGSGSAARPRHHLAGSPRPSGAVGRAPAPPATAPAQPSGPIRRSRRTPPSPRRDSTPTSPTDRSPTSSISSPSAWGSVTFSIRRSATRVGIADHLWRRQADRPDDPPADRAARQRRHHGQGGRYLPHHPHQ